VARNSFFPFTLLTRPRASNEKSNQLTLRKEVTATATIVKAATSKIARLRGDVAASAKIIIIVAAAEHIAHDVTCKHSGSGAGCRCTHRAHHGTTTTRLLLLVWAPALMVERLWPITWSVVASTRTTVIVHLVGIRMTVARRRRLTVQWIWLLYRHLRGCTSTTHLLLLTATTEEDESATTASAKQDDDGNDATDSQVARWHVETGVDHVIRRVVHCFCRRGWRRATFVDIVARTCRVRDANVIAKYIICGGTAVRLFTKKTAARSWPITESEPTRIIIIACRSVDGYVISTGGATATAAQRAV